MEDEDAAKEARVVFLQTTHKGSQQVLIPGELSSGCTLDALSHRPPMASRIESCSVLQDSSSLDH